MVIIKGKGVFMQIIKEYIYMLIKKEKSYKLSMHVDHTRNRDYSCTLYSPSALYMLSSEHKEKGVYIYADHSRKKDTAGKRTIYRSTCYHSCENVWDIPSSS